MPKVSCIAVSISAGPAAAGQLQVPSGSWRRPPDTAAILAGHPQPDR
ncbi:MAG: hypothetical protein ACRDOL_28325 [Streptosporangiaceae bacterium]